MRPIRFEAADADDWTAIGEGLTRVARAADRLLVDHEGARYAVRHDDDCAVCGVSLRAGEPFYLDPDTGAVLCETHGRERIAARETDPGSGSDAGPGTDESESTNGAERPTTDGGGRLEEREGIVFRETPERDLTLDVYRPGAGSETGDADSPTLVYVHGGAWRDRNPGEYRDGLRRLARRGLPCVNVTYRLSREATYPAAAEDIAVAVGWTRTREWVDADRVAVGGLSAGAHLATLVADAGERFAPEDAPAAPETAAAIGLSGTYDLAAAAESEPEDEEMPETAVVGVPYAEDAPPTLLVHGTDDDVLPHEGAEAYRRALAGAGVDAEFVSVDGGGHTFPFEEPWFAATNDRIRTFLGRVL